MVDRQQFSYTTTRNKYGEAVLRPRLPIILMYHGKTVETVGLLDTGADVNVMPYSLWIELGADWDQQSPLAQVSGNLADSGLSLTSPPGPLSNTWRGGEKRILKSPLHAMGRGFRGGVNA